MKHLEKLLGYRFRDPALLETALTHSSYANEHAAEKAACYERLEFLGDSILGAVTADWLYRHEPPLPEGEMTRIRAELVCEESLSRVARLLQIGEAMRLGHGEENSRGRERPSILADMVESVIAALWMDGGRDAAVGLIHDYVLRDAEQVIRQRGRDNKTLLQELVQQNPDGELHYTLLREDGPDHDKRFTFAVYINGEEAGTGTGRTKKEAEQIAAGAALKKLESKAP